ncbi:hypothetical protein G3I59_47145 [Amycolatopsis rubida]|uniref:Uncharacterized protein n=1 Tax=Amycolatopsis rubida TaxID=112413 RepID=A0ABX0C9G3_9PSEU|nr:MULTISPECIES: hypothetical protein [Amycolatopsis]MYW97988.1 hypothetical protein [Amycolatopsis rubida]NEC62973.1 hypothetical protein [Amycolatopsis rubida]OAP24473.1 hypothetical protein A4R44_04864 [Amycolatopsis sp. M39]
MTGRPARRFAPSADRRHTRRGSSEDTPNDHDTTTADESKSDTIDPESAARETYAEQQARLDAEAIDRWAAIVVDWPPMTEEQIRAIAVILNRIEARQERERVQRQQSS